MQIIIFLNNYLNDIITIVRLIIFYIIKIQLFFNNNKKQEKEEITRRN